MSSVKLIAVVLSALFMATISIVLHSPDFCLMSTAMISVPVISYAVGRLAVRGLRCRREMPEYTSEGVPVPISIRVDGRSNLLNIAEVGDALPEWVRQQNRVVPVESSPNSMLVSYTAVPLKRGRFTIGPLRVKATDPLGFFHFHSEYSLETQLTAFPRPLRIPDFALWSTGSLGEHQFEGVGAKGSGIEFHGVREYQPGDELRRVHWRSTARHGHLSVIEFEHSRAEDTLIAIDLLRGSETGSGAHSSLEYAVRIAADVAEQALMIGSLARLACAGYAGPASVPGRGRDHLYVILNALAQLNADQEYTLSDVLIGRMDSIMHGSDIVCIASSVDEGLPLCAEMLLPRGARLQVILITLGDEIPEKIEQRIRRLAASKASTTVVSCATDSIACHVRNRYGD